LEFSEIKNAIIRGVKPGGRAKCIRKKRIDLSGFHGFTRINPEKADKSGRINEIWGIEKLYLKEGFA